MARYLLFLLSFSFLLSDTSIRQNIRIKHNLEGLLNLSQFQSRNEQELIDFIESVMESDNIPGLSISIVKDENIGMDAKVMGTKFIEAMDTAFEKWKPRERYTMEVM